MTDEVILETIKAELEAADAATLKSIWQNLREAKQKTRISPDAAHKKTLQFIGENDSFDPNRQLSIKERAANKLRLKNQNREWLLEKFKTLCAAWLMVIDGKITASGKTLSDYPTPEQLLEVCHRTGKFPLLFINERVTAIEESASTWQTTLELEDYYPTVPVKLRANEVETKVIGDLDTGAISTFVNYELLAQKNIIELLVQEDAESSLHLNQSYAYLPRRVEIEITLVSGETRSQKATIACVVDWQGSPFVKINPHRTALIGREVFFKLKPCLWLDFEKRQTEIWASAMVSRTRPKADKEKKRARRPPRRNQ